MYRKVQEGKVTCRMMSSDLPKRYLYTKVWMVYPAGQRLCKVVWE
jgi:hypothetical protein